MRGIGRKIGRTCSQFVAVFHYRGSHAEAAASDADTKTINAHIVVLGIAFRCKDDIGGGYSVASSSILALFVVLAFTSRTLFCPTNLRVRSPPWP